MSEYLFDPGYGRHLVSLIFSLEDMYGTIESKVNEATSASALMEDAGEIWYAILADKSVHVFSED